MTWLAVISRHRRAVRHSRRLRLRALKRGARRRVGRLRGAVVVLQTRIGGAAEGTKEAGLGVAIHHVGVAGGGKGVGRAR